MAEKGKPIEVPVVEEVIVVGTEKFGINKLEVDQSMDIGDVVEMVFRGELIERRDDIMIFRKTGPAKTQGNVDTLTVDEMKRTLPKADR